MKFKVGDKVKCVKELMHSNELTNGEVYIVVGFSSALGRETIKIKKIDNSKCIGDFFPVRFELVKEKKKAEVLTKQEIYSNVGIVDNTVTPIKAIVSGIATILFYYSSFDYIPIERKIVAKCQEGDKFTKEDGLRICVLKAMKRELERELKQY